MPMQARAEYGCLAMLELARSHAHGEILQLRRIADEHNIPQPYLLQLLQDLKRCGLVVSLRGAAGGFRIARDPIDITLADIIDAFELDAAPKPNDQAAAPIRKLLHDLYAEADAAKRRVLAEKTLDDLVESMATNGEPTWHI
jgi:Rrf2 family protein